MGQADPDSGRGQIFCRPAKRELSWTDFIKAGAIVGVPMLMVLAQPDLGTALTYLPIAIMGLFLGGIRWRQALVIIMLGGLADAFWPGMYLKHYQKRAA